MLGEADDRWIAEHGFVDNPLWAQVALASARLSENPRIGKIYGRDRSGDVIHRLLLESGWHIYYSFDAPRNRISIVAVWFAQRGSEPPL